VDPFAPRETRPEGIFLAEIGRSYFPQLGQENDRHTRAFN